MVQQQDGLPKRETGAYGGVFLSGLSKIPTPRLGKMIPNQPQKLDKVEPWSSVAQKKTTTMRFVRRWFKQTWHLTNATPD